MATSTSSTNKQDSKQYPYPCHVNAASFVSVKLSGKPNYALWQDQMTCLVDSHDMLGFIDGTLRNPREKDGSEIMYREWKRSDNLIKGWIFGSLSEDVMRTVVGLETANDVWSTLKKNYTTPEGPAPALVSSPLREKDVGEYVSLCRAIHMGDWDKVHQIFCEDYHALTNKLNIDGHRSLHVVIGNPAPETITFLDHLLQWINPALLPTLVNNKNQNALHYAAMLDNTIAAKKLVDKNPYLLFIRDYENYLPIQKAIFNSHRTTFIYLLQMCKQHIELSLLDGYQNPFEGEHGVSLLNNIVMSGYLDVAYDLLKDYPQLATTKVDTFKTPLWCIAQKWDAYPSAKTYNFYERFIYSCLPIENYGMDDTYKVNIEKEETFIPDMFTPTSYTYPDFPTHDIENQGTYIPNNFSAGTASYTHPAVGLPPNMCETDSSLQTRLDNLRKNFSVVLPPNICETDSSLQTRLDNLRKQNYPEFRTEDGIENTNDKVDDMEDQETYILNNFKEGNTSFIYPQDVPAPPPFMFPPSYMFHDTGNPETYGSNLATKNYSVIEWIYAKFWKVALLHVTHLKHLQEDKMKHNKALMILKFICEEVGKLKSHHEEHYEDAFIVAVKNNTPEVIKEIIRTFPQSIWTRNNGYSLSQISITNRCENVYNFFVHEVTHDKYLHNVSVDQDGNNLLHLAGRLAPSHKLNMVTGATLQMQRELQWFQEVRKLVRPKDREAKNKKQETPIMIFRKEHKDLRQKGEEWMKKTADSYTITAALIITIVFAAAITVPGGNNQETGKVMFESKPSFIIFVISDAISLFTSTTSLLLFLSILTARYAEEDFLYKLPKRLIFGLIMLFMSVTTMLIAFSATLYIMFGQENSWILIAIAAITCLPIASFVTLQLPLLVDLISSTYGQRLFCKKSEFMITS